MENNSSSVSSWNIEGKDTHTLPQISWQLQESQHVLKMPTAGACSAEGDQLFSHSQKGAWVTTQGMQVCVRRSFLTEMSWVADTRMDYSGRLSRPFPRGSCLKDDVCCLQNSSHIPEIVQDIHADSIQGSRCVTVSNAQIATALRAWGNEANRASKVSVILWRFPRDSLTIQMSKKSVYSWLFIRNVLVAGFFYLLLIIPLPLGTSTKR